MLCACGFVVAAPFGVVVAPYEPLVSGCFSAMAA